MALNPPVLPGGLPMGIVGEMFFIEVSEYVKHAAQDCWRMVNPSRGHERGVNVVPPHCFLQRKGIELELSGGVPSKVKANGRLFLTSVRICFVPDKPTPGFTALDVPLQVRFIGDALRAHDL